MENHIENIVSVVNQTEVLSGILGAGAMMFVEMVRGFFVRSKVSFEGYPLFLVSVFSLLFAFLIVPSGTLGIKAEIATTIIVAVSIASSATGFKSWGKFIAKKTLKDNDIKDTENNLDLGDIKKTLKDLEDKI